MFCRNCGKELTGATASCPNCGAKPMGGTSFCPECGGPTTPLTERCPKCGARLVKATEAKTWKTRTAGILAIIAGAVGVAEWIGIAVLEILALGWLPMGSLTGLGALVTAAFVIAIGTGIVAIVGGVSAIKRRRWRLALAGSVCAVFSVIWIPVLLNVPLAIAAIVLVVLGRHEFE
jgi:hypothetical protein